MATYIVIGVTTPGDVCWDSSKGCQYSPENLALRIGDELYAMASFTLLEGELKQYRASELATAMLFFVRRALGVAPVWPSELAALTNCSFSPVAGTGREVIELVSVYERLLLPHPARQSSIIDSFAPHATATAPPPPGGALSTPVAALRSSRDPSRDKGGYAAVDAATLDAAISALTAVCLGPGTGGIASPQGPAALAAELSPDMDKTKDPNKENAPQGNGGNNNGHGPSPMSVLSMASLDNAVDSN